MKLKKGIDNIDRSLPQVYKVCKFYPEEAKMGPEFNISRRSWSFTILPNFGT